MAWAVTGSYLDQCGNGVSPNESEGGGRMNVIRNVATQDGESQFMEFTIPLMRRELSGISLRLSPGFVSPNVSFVEVPEGTDTGWHGATARRIVVILSGVLEVETGDGERRQWGAGEVFLEEDVAGRHATRAIGGPVRLLFVPFSSDFVVETWAASAQ
jgi:hypothetical protein